MKKSVLLEEYKLSQAITLKNKIVMAPLTRCFADDNLVPTSLMAEYYERRSDIGLIITEATIINPMGRGYPNTPGIYTKEQILGWKKVTEKVHKKGGKIFMQLWHVGRVSHPFYLKGKKPLAPSAVKLEGKIPRSDNLYYETPLELSLPQISHTINDYKTAALNAMEAGFDGVEIHGANGYLIDQFLHAHTNRRNDLFGGSVEKNAKFALDVTQVITKAIGAECTAIRLSPGAYFNMDYKKGDEDVFIYLLNKLNNQNLAYIHTGIFDDSMTFDYLKGSATEFLRRHYKGTLIGCGSYTLESGQKALMNKEFDLLAIGRPLIANPDLISKIQNLKELIPYDQSMLQTLV